MDLEAKFQVQMKIHDMFRFLIRHAYVGMAGVVNLVISGGAFVLFIMGAGGESAFGNAMLLLIAALFTIINPIFLYYKAVKQVKMTPMFTKPLDYIVNSTGVLVCQGEEELLMEWDQVCKVIETSKDFYLYLSLTRAYILPKDQYQTQVEIVRDVIQSHIKGKKCKLLK